MCPICVYIGTWCPVVSIASLMMAAAAVGATRTLDVLVILPSHILLTSVAAIALKILQMISPIRLSPPLLKRCVVLAALASPSLLLLLPSPPLSCFLVFAGDESSLGTLLEPGVASPLHPGGGMGAEGKSQLAFTPVEASGERANAKSALSHTKKKHRPERTGREAPVPAAGPPPLRVLGQQAGEPQTQTAIYKTRGSHPRITWLRKEIITLQIKNERAGETPELDGQLQTAAERQANLNARVVRFCTRSRALRESHTCLYWQTNAAAAFRGCGVPRLPAPGQPRPHAAAAAAGALSAQSPQSVGAGDPPLPAPPQARRR
jgi:hypothetical protein